MKKIILTVFIACFAISTQAQNFDLGVKLGANFSNINDASSLKMSSKTGLVAGGFVAIKFANWAIQPEVLYSQEGAKTDLGNFDLDYVNVPVMLKFYPIGNLINLQVGPQFGFLSKHSLKDQIETNDFDFSGVVGVGLDLPLGFRVDGRYHFSFTKVGDGGKIGNEGKNGVFTIALGYSLF